MFMGSQRCSADGAGGVNVQMLRKAPPFETRGHTAFSGPKDGSEADGGGIGPFLPVAPIQHDLGHSSRGRVWGPCSSPCAPKSVWGLGHNPQVSIKAPPFPCWPLFQVFVKHVPRV
ncbi:hypothetical protein TNIN_321121 [Trichonephila inaurata madagascariensis]|uniref:Uncharacterized protein n=1 Tax=Trichonephila inaurata madagascariensis TaxID=2747483 RepID=A0A8X6XYR0_9ARAC|nr:hypothetical protein TNIN_321121 [Trichonephila inaurata madagascariensis]